MNGPEPKSYCNDKQTPSRKILLLNSRNNRSLLKKSLPQDVERLRASPEIFKELQEKFRKVLLLCLLEDTVENIRQA